MTNDIYPLKLLAAYKDYLWGGERLKQEYGKETSLSPLAESWEVSCHADGPSVIQNGPWAGKTLAEYLQAHPNRIGAKQNMPFPLLIKLIDAAKPLSVQVHPDDAYAARVEREQGKTEMWYVLSAEPSAGIYYGFERETSLEAVQSAIETDTLTDLLHWVPAKAGDVFFIPAGTVHAIGAGILLAEVQQSSNVTYRVYDYGRIGSDGKTRPLHIKKALDVAKLGMPDMPVGPTEPPETVIGGSIQPLIACDRFHVSTLHVSGDMPLAANDASFVSLIVLDGNGQIRTPHTQLPIQKGESIFLPAGLGGCILSGQMKLLKTTL